MMSSFGDFTDTETLRLVRVLLAKPAQVWIYLTEPEKLATWLADAEIDLKLGGRVQLHMLAKDGPAAQRPMIRGTVTRCDEAQLLAFTWRDATSGIDAPETEVCFELSQQGEKTALTLIHRRLPAEWLAPVGGGWHLLLEDLQNCLLGRQPEPFMARAQAIFPEYETRAKSVRG
ncbi:MAG: SRPBCC family protein [Rhodospirillaceae bacterium]|nr:MAG: SRPBCC family protein [Rhodospirillaceae bacterium]